MGDLEQRDGAKVEARAVVIPNQAQIKKLFAEAEKQGYREFVELGFYGLRKGEILGLTWADFDGKSLDVNKQWRTDGVVSAPKTASSVRTVPLHPTTAKALMALRLRSRWSKDCDPSICTANGTHLLHSNVHRTWNRIRTAAGLPELHFHDLRHVAASILHDSGLTDAELAAAGGWANANVPKTTYTHVPDREKADERVRAAIGRIVG
jgi:integrase